MRKDCRPTIDLYDEKFLVGRVFNGDLKAKKIKRQSTRHIASKVPKSSGLVSGKTAKQNIPIPLISNVTPPILPRFSTGMLLEK